MNHIENYLHLSGGETKIINWIASNLPSISGIAVAFLSFLSSFISFFSERNIESKNIKRVKDYTEIYSKLPDGTQAPKNIELLLTQLTQKMVEQNSKKLNPSNIIIMIIFAVGGRLSYLLVLWAMSFKGFLAVLMWIVFGVVIFFLFCMKEVETMFQTAPGVTIPFPNKILEKYQIFKGESIFANVSYEKLSALVTDFYRALPEPLFFVMQLPLSIYEENKMGFREIVHQEVLYLDGQTQSQIDTIMSSYGQLLLSDGLSQFAIASHKSHEEIFIQKYKVVSIYSEMPEKHVGLLTKYGLHETDKLITAWNTFSPDYPGECRRICMEGLDAYTVADILKKQGMYRAKIIEND
ncbi:hypothetical protein ACVS9P_02260 [Caproicibacterium sp. NSD3]